MDIQVRVVEKVATALDSARIVCGNSDYKIKFSFDEEWSSEAQRTARFSYRKHSVNYYKDVAFTGDTVAVPVLADIHLVSVGVYAGNLRTTTPARIVCLRSILCDDRTAEEVSPVVWAELQGQIGNLENLDTEAKGSLVEAINEAAQTTTGGGTAFTTDETLSLVDGVLSVNTADAPEQDNTLPITSAAVHTTVGNIEILLGTI